MKITIQTDEQCTETEIAVICNRMSGDIEKLIAAIRMYDLKLTGTKDGKQFILDAADVLYIDTIDKHTFLYTKTAVYESPLKLYELEEKLIDRDFLRASKSCLFNINYVESIEYDSNRRLILTMENQIKLMVSRQYMAAVKHKLEVYHG